MKEEPKELKALRDIIAISAMEGLCSTEWAQEFSYEKIALMAYEQADAMLKARGAQE